MRAVPVCIAALAVLCTPAVAQIRYDLKLEKAAMEIIARKIGEIRPTMMAEPPARQVVSDDAFASGPARAAPGVQGPPVPLPGPVHKDWQVLRGSTDMSSVSDGSFQSFSGGLVLSPEERRKAASRPVSRIINF
ncbi:MAG: hypothetical protein KF914_20425 [Rhizobiaceae bacterium]|nr:hypothetical protein [Rhizobiaceae bacterium]